MSTWRSEPASFRYHGSWRVFSRPIRSGATGATSERDIFFLDPGDVLAMLGGRRRAAVKAYVEQTPRGQAGLARPGDDRQAAARLQIAQDFRTDPPIASTRRTVEPTPHGLRRLDK